MGVPDLGLSFGLYQIYWRAERFESGIADARDLLPQDPAAIMFFRDLNPRRGFPLTAVEIIDQAKAIPIISLELATWGDRGGRHYVQDIIDGNYDDFFRDWAKACQQWGKPVMLRPGFEMNGSWFSWSGHPKQFIQAWKHMHQLFTQAQCDNVIWVWSPGVESFPEEEWNQLEAYYPGDEFVDWLGLDGYNWGPLPGRPELRWKSFQEIFEKPLQQLAALAPDKPVMMAEVSCAESEEHSKAEWIQSACAAMKNNPNVKMFVWFNFDKRREKECDWRFNSSEDSLNAFRAGTKDCHPWRHVK